MDHLLIFSFDLPAYHDTNICTDSLGLCDGGESCLTTIMYHVRPRFELSMMNRYCMYVGVLLYCLCTFVVPSVPVGGVVVSVYQSGPCPDDLTAVVNWKKLSPMELRGKFVKYIVEINQTVS